MKHKHKQRLSSEHKAPETKKRTVYLSIGLVVLMGLAVYSNSLRGEFLLDDTPLVEDNVLIRDVSGALNIFTKNIGEYSGKKFNFYRPLQVLTYMIDYHFFGFGVLGYHLTNTILHIGVALLLFWLIALLFGDVILSLFTSILFVVHPVHTEAVSYISGRADSLVSVFILSHLNFSLFKGHEHG